MTKAKRNSNKGTKTTEREKQLEEALEEGEKQLEEATERGNQLEVSLGKEKKKRKVAEEAIEETLDIYAIISLVMDASYLKVSTASIKQIVEQIVNGSFHSELIRMENTQLFEWIHENSPELSSETVHVLIDVLKRKRIFSNVHETRIALRL